MMRAKVTKFTRRDPNDSVAPVANRVHVQTLKRGAEKWNEWRLETSEKPNLNGANLGDANLSKADLREANLREADLTWANLCEADLGEADLGEADLRRAFLCEAILSQAKLGEAKLSNTDLSGANLSEAYLYGADLSGADLSKADLSGANLSEADLSGANLSGADLSGAVFRETVFGDIDLSNAINLDTCRHHGPSIVDNRTLGKSGNLPLAFLRGVGFSDPFIDYFPSLFGKGIEFFSAFLSHNSRDKDIVRRIYDSLQGQGVRCWLGEKQIHPGDDLYDEIDRGIQSWDKLVLVCSEQSMTSWWVEHEWKKAMEKERHLRKERGEKVLAIIPIDIDGFIHSDECNVSVKSEILSRAAADFTVWKDHDAFEKAMEGLVGALRADGGGKPPSPEPKL